MTRRHRLDRLGRAGTFRLVREDTTPCDTYPHQNGGRRETLMPEDPVNDQTAMRRESGRLRHLNGRLGIVLAGSALAAVVAYWLLSFLVPDLVLRTILATGSRWAVRAPCST